MSAEWENTQDMNHSTEGFIVPEGIAQAEKQWWEEPEQVIVTARDTSNPGAVRAARIAEAILNQK